MTRRNPADGDRRRWVALSVLCAGFLMIIIDQTIVNVALPAIQRDLHFSQANLSWILNAYLIPFGGLLLLAGRIGDLIGRKRVFIIGLIVFTVASAICGFAQNELMLIVARFAQGAGGALASAGIIGMIVALFPEPDKQARAMAIYAFTAAGGAGGGMFLGGLLTQAISWHWIFFVNLPIGGVTAIIGMRVLNRDAGIGFKQGADVPGALLIVASLMLGVYAIVQTASHGWGSAQTLITGGIAIALLAGFLARQATARQPLMRLGIFKIRTVSAANISTIMLMSGMFPMLVLAPLFLQGVLGYSPIGTGAAMLPNAVTVAIVSMLLTAKITMRFGGRQTLLLGLALVAGGLLLFSNVPLHGGYLQWVLPVLLLWGVGAGLAYPSVIQLAMSGAPLEDVGLASGIVNTSINIGGALALSVIVTLSTTRTNNLELHGVATRAALASGYHLAFLIGGFLVLAGLALTPIILRRNDGAMPAPEAEPAAKLGAVEASYSED
jgi:EmrB/QacA subfamily drug resistance transporter